MLAAGSSGRVDSRASLTMGRRGMMMGTGSLEGDRSDQPQPGESRDSWYPRGFWEPEPLSQKARRISRWLDTPQGGRESSDRAHSAPGLCLRGFLGMQRPWEALLPLLAELLGLLSSVLLSVALGTQPWEDPVYRAGHKLQHKGPPDPLTFLTLPPSWTSGEMAALACCGDHPPPPGLPSPLAATNSGD